MSKLAAHDAGWGQEYLYYLSRIQNLSGTLWGIRFCSCRPAVEIDLLNCQRCIVSNPLWGGMMEHSPDYPWTTPKVKANDAVNHGLADRSVGVRLEYSAEKPEAVCRKLFGVELEAGSTAQIHGLTNGGPLLGRECFAREARLMRRGAYRWVNPTDILLVLETGRSSAI